MSFRKKFKIGNKEVGEGCPPFLIAEIGRNHNGDMELAKKMIDHAKEAGADAVKFQSFTAQELLIKELPKVSHAKETLGAHQSMYESTEEVELKPDQHSLLQAYAKERDILFMSTPEDPSFVTLLDDLGVPAFKIASLDIGFLDLIERIAKTGRPVILSTGMSYLGEVEKALSILKNHGVSDVVVLHCTSNYPPSYEDVNLRAMNTIAEAFDVVVGYSDHTSGIGVSIGAVARGAKVIERHFTLDKELPGPDHRISLTPSEFSQMAREARDVWKALGSKVKAPVEKEKEMRRLHRRRLVASKKIDEGKVLERSDISCKCSEFGLDPEHLPLLIGKTTRQGLNEDEPLSLECVH